MDQMKSIQAHVQEQIEKARVQETRINIYQSGEEGVEQTLSELERQKLDFESLYNKSLNEIHSQQNRKKQEIYDAFKYYPQILDAYEYTEFIYKGTESLVHDLSSLYVSGMNLINYAIAYVYVQLRKLLNHLKLAIENASRQMLIHMDNSFQYLVQVIDEKAFPYLSKLYEMIEHRPLPEELIRGALGDLFRTRPTLPQPGQLQLPPPAQPQIQSMPTLKIKRAESTLWNSERKVMKLRKF